MKPIYLDHAAATPVDSEVLMAMMPFFSDKFYNPSALYTGARDVKQALDEARSSVAQAIGCRPGEVIFTSGGTESTNLAIRGVCGKYPDGRTVISAIEHEAVRMPAKLYDHVECPVNGKGQVEIDQLRPLIDEHTVLVSVMYANNEVGTVQPIKDVVSLVEEERTRRLRNGVELPIYVHTDAAQAPSYLDLNVARLGVDMMTLNGGKIHGPKQSGILYVRTGVKISPQILGGGQERSLRSGTENIANAVGFSLALRKAQDGRSANSKAVGQLSAKFIKTLEEKFGAVVNGHKKMRLPNNVHVTFPGHDNERIMFSLDEQGVYAAAGSACSASKEEVSHVLRAMGVSEQDARSSLRFSLGRETSEEDIKKAVEYLAIALDA